MVLETESSLMNRSLNTGSRHKRGYLELLESESEVTQSCLTLCDPMDSSLPGSCIHGVFQARILEWIAISFSTIWSSWWLKVWMTIKK